MPLTDKAKKKEYDRLYYQRKKKMSYQQAITFIREAKNFHKRSVSANTTANELLDEFVDVYKSSAVELEVEKLPRDLLPNEATDELEMFFSSLTRKERAAERQKLLQKVKFLDRMDANEDILANRFIEDVRFAMDTKVKAKELEEADLEGRRRLGKSTLPTTVMEPIAPAPAPEPKAQSSIWDFFGAGGGAESSAKRPRPR